MSIALGIDIGGSAIKSALVDCKRGRLAGDVTAVPLPASRSIEDVVNVIGDLINQKSFAGPVGVGFPGIVRHGQIHMATHLALEWVGYDFLQALSDRFTNQFAILNDADGAGLAEMRFGAGQEEGKESSGTVMVFTLGTGIGSALFTGGQLVPNTEFGHVEIDGIDAETLAAASVKTRENLDWEEFGGRLNRYLATIRLLLSPDLVIIGGGISDNFDKFGTFLDAVDKIKPAGLGNTAGLIGAACCAAESV